MTINWRRFAILGSAVITGVAVIRLIADYIGIPRGTRASVLVSVFSNVVMLMALGLSTPYVLSGIRPQPLWRRIVVLLPLATFSAVINYLLLADDL